MNRITILTLPLFFSTSLFSQETKKKVEVTKKKFLFTGSVDAYFKRKFSGPNEAFKVEDRASYCLSPATSFGNRSGFSLGMVNLIASYEGEKVGFVADLVFGPRGEDAVFLSVGSANTVNQLYMYWNVSEKVTFTIGNFNTFLGYKVISPVSNFNYSTSYMFSYGPFSHTGLRADISPTEDLSLLLAVMNSTDYTEINLDGCYTFGAQFVINGQLLNVIYGEQTGTTGLTNQTDYTSNAGAIGTYNANGDTSVIDVTLTGSYAIGDFTIKPELRLDSTSEETFVDSDLEPSKSLTSFLFAAVCHFN